MTEYVYTNIPVENLFQGHYFQKPRSCLPVVLKPIVKSDVGV